MDANPTHEGHLLTGKTGVIAQKEVKRLILDEISSKLPLDRSDEASQLAEGGKKELCRFVVCDSLYTLFYRPLAVWRVWL